MLLLLGQFKLCLKPCLEVLRWLDDGGLPEPGDLRPRVALHLAHKLGGAPVGRRLRRHLLDDARRERVLPALGLCWLEG